MKCDRCNGQGFSVIAKWKCPVCDGKGVVEPLTEQEYLQTCNTEQLAEALNKIFTTKSFCHICHDNDVCDLGYECKYEDGEVEDFRKWLKQPHTKVPKKQEKRK